MKLDASLEQELEEGADLEELVEHYLGVCDNARAIAEDHKDAIQAAEIDSAKAIEAGTTLQRMTELAETIARLRKYISQSSERLDRIDTGATQVLMLLEVMLEAYGPRMKFEDLGVLNSEPARKFADTLVAAEEGNSAIGSIAYEAWMKSQCRIASRVVGIEKHEAFTKACDEAGKKLNAVMGTKFHGLTDESTEN